MLAGRAAGLELAGVEEGHGDVEAQAGAQGGVVVAEAVELGVGDLGPGLGAGEVVHVHDTIDAQLADLIKSRNRSDEYFDQFNYELYGGTPVLGINSNVLIGHGISSSLSFKNMLLLAKDVVDARLNDKITQIFQ